MADGILIGDLPSAAALTTASDFTYVEQPAQSVKARKITVAALLAPALKGPYYIYTVDAGSGDTLGLSMETGQHMSVRFSGTAAFTTVQVPDGEYVGQIVAITNDRAINLAVEAVAPSTTHKTIVLGNGDSCTLTWEGSGSWRAEVVPSTGITNYALSAGGGGDGLDFVGNNGAVAILNLTGGTTYPTATWISFFTMVGVPVGGLILVQNRTANAVSVKTNPSGLSVSAEVSCGPGNAILLERSGTATLNAYALDDSAWRNVLLQEKSVDLTLPYFLSYTSAGVLVALSSVCDVSKSFLRIRPLQYPYRSFEVNGRLAFTESTLGSRLDAQVHLLIPRTAISDVVWSEDFLDTVHVGVTNPPAGVGSAASTPLGVVGSVQTLSLDGSDTYVRVVSGITYSEALGATSAGYISFKAEVDA